LADKMQSVPFSPGEAAQLVETLARAVHYAHQRGIIHRDVKPSNVLLTADGTPKITDFGLAKRLDRADLHHTQSGEILGTPAYMAPEQAQGRVHEIGPAADMFSLGALLYQCLTGRLPFQGGTPLDTLHQLLHEDPVPPRQLQPTVPPDLEAIVLQCLQKEPARRYASAEALADDLRSFREGRPIQAQPPSVWQRVRRWFRGGRP
jgi:serine/threonine protein kinase